MKHQTFNLGEIQELTLYTGSNGRRGCSCNCPGCSQTNYGERHAGSFHQGTLTQIQEIITLLPNLQKAYFLGNPDCSIDSIFCSKAAKMFIQHGIHVMFSTSGIGSVETLKKLLNGLDLNFVDYISFSIDSINCEIESMLKGTRIDYTTLLKGIEYCHSLSIPVKIQPTVWQINQDTLIDTMEFFNSKYQINWFTFHVGSCEGFHPHSSKICKHVLPDKWHETSQEILSFAKEKNLHVYVPHVFLTESEYEVYQKDYLPHCKNNHPTNIQIWMEDTLKASYYPILASIGPELFVSDFTQNMLTNQPDNKTNNCIAQKLSLGKELSKDFHGNISENYGQNFFYVCRYYKTTT